MSNARPHRYGFWWTPEEDTFLRENLHKLGFDGVASAIGRTRAGVQWRAKWLGVLTRRFFTKAEVEFIKQHYPEHGATHVATQLGRSRSAVIAIANDQGVYWKRRKIAIPTPRAKALLGIYADKYQCSVGDILSWRKTAPVVMARYSVARELQAAGYSTTRIGKSLGRDHSSICMGLKRLVRLEATV
jgi:hypothetical protein